jgi:hypothetical protein
LIAFPQSFPNLSAIFPGRVITGVEQSTTVHSPKGARVPKYRRIEVNAFRRRVTIVSGEWPAINLDSLPAKTEENISVDDSDSCEPVEPDSPEGQVILVEAVRSLERRLSPEARAMIRSGTDTHAHYSSSPRGLYLKLQSFYLFICPEFLRFVRREK